MTAASIYTPASPAARLLDAADRSARAISAEDRVGDELARASWAQRSAATLAARAFGPGLLPLGLWRGYPDATAVAPLDPETGLFLHCRLDAYRGAAVVTLLAGCPRCRGRWEAEVADRAELEALLAGGHHCPQHRPPEDAP